MKKKHLKVLQEINNSVPKEWFNNLTHEVMITPTIKEVVLKALEDDSVPEKKKEQFRNMLETGRFDKTKEEINKDIELLLDDFYETEIQKAITDGRLPKQINDPFIKKVKQRLKKKYEQARSSTEGDKSNDGNDTESGVVSGVHERTPQGNEEGQ